MKKGAIYLIDLKCKNIPFNSKFVN